MPVSPNTTPSPRARQPVAGTAATEQCSTVGRMKIPGANHLSRRLQLTPRDYVNPPEGFGWNGEVKFEAPLDGDQLSLAVARRQHVLVKAWRQRQRTGHA